MAENRIGTPVPGSPSDARNLLRLLEEAQRRVGFLPENLLRGISESLAMPLSYVYGVATFYSFLSVKEQGRHIIRVCKSLPCYMKNSQQIVRAIEDATGTALGTNSRDARFSIRLTNCIGECDRAPAMLIDGHAYFDLTTQKIAQILKGYE